MSHNYRSNPLKDKLWKERLQELQRLGLDAGRLRTLEQNFNTEHNDATHALYITDWLRARLTLEKFSGNRDLTDEEYGILSRYYTRYKLTDYHSLSLDDELQIEHFDTLLHYAQLAHTQYVFRRLPWSSIPPSALIAELKEREMSAKVNLYYRPKHHTPIITYPNGWAWVIMQPEDREAEAASLGDCASPEGENSIILSLRQPLEGGYFQTRLRAQLALPKKLKVPAPDDIRPDNVNVVDWQLGYPLRFKAKITPDVIKDSHGLIVQLRKYHNHKPGTPIGFDANGSECQRCRNLSPGDRQHIDLPLEAVLPYIFSLLSQPWVTWVIKPAYRSEETFLLEDLPPELRTKLHRNKPWMFNIKSFNRRFGIDNYHHYSYYLGNLLQATPAELLLKIQKGRVDGVRKRLESGIKYQRQAIFNAIESTLLRSKSKAVISRLLELLTKLTGFRQSRRIAVNFFRQRLDWLLQHLNYLARTMDILCLGPGDSPGLRTLNYETYQLLADRIVQDPTTHTATTIFKLMFKTSLCRRPWYTPFDGKQKRKYHLSTHYVAHLLEHILPRLENPIGLKKWLSYRPLPFGRSTERHMLSDFTLTTPLLQKLLQLYTCGESAPKSPDLAGPWLAEGPAWQYVAAKLLDSQAKQLRELAAQGKPTQRRAARRLLDAIYRNLLNDDFETRTRSGQLLEKISQRRRRLRRRNPACGGHPNLD